MQMPNRKGWFAILFILLTLAIPFAIAYYVSTQTFQDRYNQWQESSRNAFNRGLSRQQNEKIILIKDKKLVVGKTGIVFKGLFDSRISLNLYLLELDPLTPYPLNVSKHTAREGFWIANHQYQLVSVKKKALHLKIKDTYNTL